MNSSLEKEQEFLKSNGSDWIYEYIHLNSYDKNFGSSIKVNSLEYFDYNGVKIYNSDGLGKLLFLNNELQLCENAEKKYHEVCHIPMFNLVHKLRFNKLKILVIGGGDGCFIREILKYKEVDLIDWVEICPTIIDACKENLPFSKINQSLSSKKVNIHIKNGLHFVKDCEKKYHLILVDCSDPKGKALDLFTNDFYENCYNILNPSGLFFTNCVSYLNSPKITKNLYYKINSLFQNTKYYNVPYIYYVGGSHGFLLGHNSPISYRYIDKVSDLQENQCLAYENICPEIYKNKRRDIYDKICNTFFDWNKHLSATEKKYVDKCISYDGEFHQNDKLNLSLYTFSLDVFGNNYNFSRMGWGSIDKAEKLKPLIKDILREKGINLGKSFDEYVIPAGLAWDIENNIFKIYFLSNAEVMKKFLPNLYFKMFKPHYKEGLISLSFKCKEGRKPKIIERKIYLYDSHDAYMITDKRGVVRQININENLLNYQSVGKRGQDIIDYCDSIGLRLDTINYSRVTKYTLYFQE